MLPLTVIASPTITQERSDWVAQMIGPSQFPRQATVSSATNNDTPIRALIAYVDNLEEERYRQRINKVLKTISRQIGRNIYPTLWEIAFGNTWQYDDSLETSHLSLLLIGPDFVDTDFCYCDQLKEAIERHYYHQTYVVPIYLRPCLLENVPFGCLSLLPSHAQGAVSTQNEDIAFQTIAQGITYISRLIIDNLL